MTEQGNGGHTPTAFTFIDGAIPDKGCEGSEGALGTSDDYLTYIDEYINDAWKVLNRQTDATDINDASDSGSTNYGPVVTTGRAVHAWPSTSRAGIEKVSSTTKDIARSSDDAWRYQLNTQHTPTTDQTYNLDGVSSSGSPSHLQVGPTSSIDHTKPSTSHAGMVEASARLQYGARNPQTTWVHQRNTQYYPTEGTSPIQAQKREAPVSHFQSSAATAVAATMQWPVQAPWARSKHRAFREMMLEFLTSPALSHGLCSTTRLVAQLQSTMSRAVVALLTCTWSPAAASIAHSPAQAALAWWKHQPF
ncbi:uncharacterized protein [Dermacentor albipictus]|uniref:uncharacterized protein isoform X6 n=1 Tax=Dermacentor albipictus TaxID=60249 RepID=UPI0038FC3D02